MSNLATIASNGTILSWQHAGVDILYPEKMLNNESRGGLPLCVPMFSVQQRPVIGCQLPLHGRLMYLPAEPVTKLAAGQSWEKELLFVAEPNFAWGWSVKLLVSLTEFSLTYQVTVARSSDCQNPNEMPLSLGFHPYFNTFGKDFSFQIAGKTYAKSTLPKKIIDSDFAPLTDDEAAVLRTAAHTLTITSRGYDEYCLWSDDMDKYFCIEPIYLYRAFGLPGTGLQVSETKTVSATLAVAPLTA